EQGAEEQPLLRGRQRARAPLGLRLCVLIRRHRRTPLRPELTRPRRTGGRLIDRCKRRVSPPRAIESDGNNSSSNQNTRPSPATPEGKGTGRSSCPGAGHSGSRHLNTGRRTKSMTPQQVALVRQSFAKVVPIREQAAALFYDRLFAIDESTRPLFRGDMKSQGAKLMAAIGAVVKSLDRIETMLDDLRALARRHDGYGVREEHYASVGAALLGTLEQGL